MKRDCSNIATLTLGFLDTAKAITTAFMRTRSLHQVAPRHCQGASLLKQSLLDPFLSLIELATWKFHSCNHCLFELRATDVTRCPKICVNQGQTWCCLVVSRPTKKSLIFGYESPDPQKPQQCAAVNLQCGATRMSFGCCFFRF